MNGGSCLASFFCSLVNGCRHVIIALIGRLMCGCSDDSNLLGYLCENSPVIVYFQISSSQIHQSRSTNLKRRAILGILVVVVIAFVFFAPVISAPLNCTANPTQINYSISLFLTHYIGAYYSGRMYYFSPLSPIPNVGLPRCL